MDKYSLILFIFFTCFCIVEFANACAIDNLRMKVKYLENKLMTRRRFRIVKVINYYK